MKKNKEKGARPDSRTLKVKKERDPQGNAQAVLENYASFLSWLENFLFSQLYPSAAFARRTISLAILSMLVEGIQRGQYAQ
jgi:hypothetical protein